MAPPHGTPELQAELARIAKAIVNDGRGILAADESTGKNSKVYSENISNDISRNHRKTIGKYQRRK